MSASDGIPDRFERDGYVWFRNAIGGRELERLRALSRAGTRPGARVPENDPLFEEIVSAGFVSRLRSIWPDMRPVRLVSFDKNDKANWGVPWHQDRVIAVAEKAALRGYSNWSNKRGAWHCEPPVGILEEMLFVRVHLDRSTAENGAMEIAPGSHRLGKIAADKAAAVAEGFRWEMTIAEPGDVLALAMLTLHRSLPASGADNRRVLRVDFANRPLPAPLRWSAQVAVTG